MGMSCVIMDRNQRWNVCPRIVDARKRMVLIGLVLSADVRIDSGKSGIDTGEFSLKRRKRIK